MNIRAVEAQQLRATWIARSSFSTKAALAAVMDSLAANNFNVAYVNVWSRGYPLRKSDRTSPQSESKNIEQLRCPIFNQNI